jgi:PAS domain S-box-containing protein
MPKSAKSKKINTDELRSRAEQCLQEQPVAGHCDKEAESCKLMHELQVYTLELEMQNEEILSSQAQAYAALDRYTELFDFAPVGYLTLNNKGRIIEINLTGAAILGVERAGIIGSLMTAYIVNQKLFMRYLDQVFNYANNVVIELSILRPDGSLLDVQMESRASTGEEACPLQIRTILTDISGEKSLERQLQLQRSELELLVKQQVAIQTAAAIAHDLNQPLAAISAFSEAALDYLNKEVTTAEPLQRALKGCVEQAQRAGLCLHELLGFLQKRELVTEPFNLNLLIQDVLTIIQHDRCRDFKPEIRLDSNLPSVIANPLQARKALQNLLCNSLDAMEGTGFKIDDILITVSTRAEWNMAQVTVQDSGPGIDADTAKRIFEPFFTTKLNGSGLGLAISRSLIEANGGQLWMEPNVSQGAIFHFTLPFAPTHE